MEHASIRLPEGRLSPFGPSAALDRAVTASALHANPRVGEALALAAQVALYFRQHRDVIEGFAALANDLSDMIDGDPDFEDATNAEDDHALSAMAIRYARPGPGCAVSDGRQCQEDMEADDQDEADDDTEANGDENDGNNAEDEVLNCAFGSGLGCPISAPGDERQY